jgi:hypothetical protein
MGGYRLGRGEEDGVVGEDHGWPATPSRSGDDRDSEECLPAHRLVLPVHERYAPRAAGRVGDAQVYVVRAGQVRVEAERLVSEARLANASVVRRVQRVPNLRHPPLSPDPRTAAKGSADWDCQQAPRACPRLGGGRDGASGADCQTGNQTDRGLGADVAGEDGLGVGVDAGEAEPVEVSDGDVLPLELGACDRNSGFSAVSWSSPPPGLCGLVSGRFPAAASGRGHRDRVGAAVAEPDQLEGVGDVTEPEADPELAGPFFDGVGDDLQGSAAGSANQVVVVAGPAGKPVAAFALVTAEGVDRAGSGQRPKLVVDGGYPDP